MFPQCRLGVDLTSTLNAGKLFFSYFEHSWVSFFDQVVFWESSTPNLTFYPWKINRERSPTSTVQSIEVKPMYLFDTGTQKTRNFKQMK